MSEVPTSRPKQPVLCHTGAPFLFKKKEEKKKKEKKSVILSLFLKSDILFIVDFFPLILIF